MKFKTYFFALSKSERQLFAGQVGTSVGHLNNFSYGYTSLSPVTCAAIEKQTGGEITRKDLRPEDFWKIWPDLERDSQVVKKRKAA